MIHSTSDQSKFHVLKICLLGLCTSLMVGNTLVISGNAIAAPEFDGSNIPIENSTSLELPQVLSKPVANKLIRRVSRDTGVFSNKLKIVEVKSKNFDGCFGIYRPNQVCTKQLIQGWQAIITSPNRSYVYHLTQSGDQIIQNDIASGATSRVRVSFELFGGNNTPQPESNLVFRSSSAGDLLGRMSSIVLTNDGKIIRYQSSPTAHFAPFLIKTLSRTQINEFNQQLNDRRSLNFNGLSYLTSAALADYPTTTYQSQEMVMQFIDLEKKNFPRSLQQLIVNWETLIQP